MIELVIDARRKDLGGFEVGRVLPFHSRRMVGPFIFLDQMGPAEFAPGAEAIRRLLVEGDPTGDITATRAIARIWKNGYDVAATPAQDARRPSTHTRWTNLYLAGDWTDTGLPSTIEGALRSGERAAALALSAMN